MVLRGFALQTEQRAQRLRELAGLHPTDKIDPLEIGRLLEGIVLIPGFDDLRRRVGRNLDRDSLEAEVSALTIQIDETFYIIENQTHTPARRRVSLMEEFSHIILGHEPTTVSLNANALLTHRTFNDRQEREAYALGAATLVPYAGLQELLFTRRSSFAAVGEHYEVSEELIAYRAKVTLLWRQLKKAGLLEAAREVGDAQAAELHRRSYSRRLG